MNFRALSFLGKIRPALITWGEWKMNVAKKGGRG
jgi:hypothetical protein